MSIDFEIYKMNKEHVSEVSKIHEQELKIGFLNLFGSEFLKKMYFSLLDENWGFVAISKENKEVIGYIFASRKQISLFKCLSIYSLLIFFTNACINFRKLKGFLISFKYLYLNRKEKLCSLNKDMIELSHFAIKEPFKGCGLGKNLISIMEIEAKKHKIKFIFTRTHNNRLVKFYMKKKHACLCKKLFLGSHISYSVKWKIM